MSRKAARSERAPDPCRLLRTRHQGCRSAGRGTISQVRKSAALPSFMDRTGKSRKTAFSGLIGPSYFRRGAQVLEIQVRRGAGVYRCFDARGSLLYVGRTGNLVARLGHHAWAAPWWARCDRVTFTPCADHAASRLEAEAIRIEQPEFNKTHLKPAPHRVAAVLREHGPSTASQLMALLNVRRRTLSRLVKADPYVRLVVQGAGRGNENVWAAVEPDRRESGQRL